MKVRIEFDCDNAAFEDNGFIREARNVLHEAGNRLYELRNHRRGGEAPLFDSNGNSIGTVTLERD